ncbi:MAG TPA: hypothetical protein PLL09_00610 [Flavobacterium sp.]|uniref:tetratricopeptide repeat protein n=1 Tax=unclassified Flavobacterium TaxID=196869 RepID=UPI0025BDE056|nr:MULTISPECIES: hypothetical protein [unclassified Flavobacterium]HRE76301.1 hypothetical protein [Flavobacterium sp.]
MERIFAILLLFISSTLLGQIDSKKYYDESIKLTDSKEYQQALTSINSALLSDSLNRSYLLQKIKILFFINKCNDAMNNLDLIIEHVDATIQDDIMANFCDINDCLGKQEEATRLLEKYIIHKQFQSNEMILYLAIRLCNNKKYDEGISYYKQYIKLKPDDIYAIIDFSRIIYAYQGSENGINEIKNSLQNNPNNLELLNCLVAFYNYNKDNEKAIEVQNQIIQLNYTVENIKLRAVLFSQIGKQDKEYEDLNRIIEIDKCNIEYYSKILQYEFDNKMYEKVVENSFKVIECNKDFEHSILDGLYTSLFFLNEPIKGELYLDKKIALNPTTFNPYYLKSTILLKNNQLENVMKYLDLCLKASDLESSNLINVSFLKLSYYLLSEDYEGFKNYFNSVQVKSLDTNLNFTFSESEENNKSDFTIDFDKNTGIINSTLIIPTKILKLLMSTYGLKIK